MQQLKCQVKPLCPHQETKMELQTPGFGLASIGWCSFGGSDSANRRHCIHFSLLLCHSNTSNNYFSKSSSDSLLKHQKQDSKSHLKCSLYIVMYRYNSS